MNKYFIFPLVFVFAMSQVCWAADVKVGEEAYKQGDYISALKEFMPAAEEGDPVAQFYLGVLYSSGQGVQQSDIEALKWFIRSAEQGIKSAQFNAGVAYEKGQGVIPDIDEAIKWYRKASEQGDLKSKYLLGWLYYKNKKNYNEAYNYFKQLASLGMPEALYMLGVMYQKGEGHEMDYNRSYIFLYTAYKRGFENAKEDFVVTSMKLSEEQKNILLEAAKNINDKIPTWGGFN